MTAPAALRSRPLRVALLALAPLLGACDDGETVTISGDIAGLDTIGYRGDSLIANAGRVAVGTDTPLAPGVSVATDSSASSIESVGASAASTSTDGRGLPGVNPMTRRAQARGDSMARAAAMRLVGVGGADSRSRADTVRGTVTVVGQPPALVPKLRMPNGVLVALSGMATSGLTRLDGAEITVRGVRLTPREVVVTDYLVRGMHGVPALDGRLVAVGDGWAIDLTDGSGRRRLAGVPGSLQSATGARVWVSLRAGTSTPETFGLIGRR